VKRHAINESHFYGLSSSALHSTSRAVCYNMYHRDPKRPTTLVQSCRCLLRFLTPAGRGPSPCAAARRLAAAAAAAAATTLRRLLPAPGGQPGRRGEGGLKALFGGGEVGCSSLALMLTAFFLLLHCQPALTRRHRAPAHSTAQHCSVSRAHRAKATLAAATATKGRGGTATEQSYCLSRL
jgi:hypothetical protein